MTEALSVSVLLCTRNGARRLPTVLTALADQTLGRSRFEVVVVDDGSTDETRQVAASFEGVLPLRYARQRRVGDAAAKNHALALARGSVVVFVDDEAVLRPDALDAHWRAHGRHSDERVAIVGRTSLSTEAARAPLMQFIELASSNTGAGGGVGPLHRADYTALREGRWSCKRSFLMARGVFNPAFQAGGGDVELGYRLSWHGLRLHAEPTVMSSVFRTLDYDEFCRRSYLEGQSNWTLAALHAAREVRAWAAVDDVEAAWQAVASRMDAALHTGRELHDLARGRLEAGLSLDLTTRTLLYGCYHRASSACRLKGAFDRMRENRVATTSERP